MKRTLLSLLCTLLLTGTPASAGDLSAGFRGSKIYPNNTPAYWANVGDAMANYFDSPSTTAVPAAVWIVSFYGSNGNIYATFPSGGTPLAHVSYTAVDFNEPFLAEFDKRGVKVWLQVESGAAAMEGLIDAVLARYKHHPCVAGFGVDVEWLDQQIDNLGRPVTDAEAAAWEKRVRAVDTTYSLFLKHFTKNRMPPAYRGNIVFVDDSQQFSSYLHCLGEFKAWGQAFAPSRVAFQFGYAADRSWWSQLARPPQTIGAALLASIPNTAGLFWVDFTITEVFPIATTSIAAIVSAPVTAELCQNFPNPFNPSTVIRYTVPYPSHVRIALYTSIGSEVRVLFDGTADRGPHALAVDCTGLPAGVYFYRLTTEGYSETRSMTFMK